MRIDERAELAAWLGDQPRHADQTHAPHESDAEIVRLRDDLYLAVSVDAIAEEIAGGLYQDEHTIGWLAAIAGLADLAAVGADPVGVLMTATWDVGWSIERRQAVAGGFAAALQSSGTALLGGDTSASDCTVLAATAVGVTQERPMTRTGAVAGDRLCITGWSGAGTALGARYLIGDDAAAFPDSHYRPRARLAEGVALRPLASACTDASDGILRAVQMLTGVNQLGAALVWNPEVLDEPAVSYIESKSLPLWLTWVSELGDYELVAAIPEANWPAAQAAVPSLKTIGTLTEEPDVTVSLDGRSVPVNLSTLPSFSRADPELRTELLTLLLTQIREHGLP